MLLSQYALEAVSCHRFGWGAHGWNRQYNEEQNTEKFMMYFPDYIL